MARVSEAHTKAEGEASSSRTAAASGRTTTVSSIREARPVVERWRPCMARVQPERRSSPMRESLRQPIQAMRLVAAVEQVGGGQVGPGRTVDVDPGVVGGLGSSHGRPKATNGARRSLQPGGLRVAEVGVGHDERVDGGGAQQVVVPARAWSSASPTEKSRTW